MINYSSSCTRTKYCLNGFWDFSIASDNLECIPSEWDSVKIKVPSPYNVNSFMKSYRREFCGVSSFIEGGDFILYPEYPAEWENAPRGFYKRTITISEEMRQSRLFIHFDAVAFKSVFYINGKLAGTSGEAFLPVEIEITKYVEFGTENELCVACETARGFTYKDSHGKNRLDYPRGSFWGEHIAGIWQDVWLIERPKSYISDLYAVTDVYSKELKLQFALKSDNCADYNIDFYLSEWGKTYTGRKIASVSAASADKTITWNWHDGEIKLWDFLEPNLYEIRAELKNNDEPIDEYKLRIGFRTFGIEKDKFILNGKPINLKNDSWHYLGYTIQTPEYARAYIKMALDAGVNIIRQHAEPFPEFFADIADETGMLLVSESAVWASHCMFSYSPDFFKNASEHLSRMIMRDRNHPSVVMWSAENECIAAYHFCGSEYVKTVDELEEKVYDFLKVIYNYDCSRPVACDGSGDLGGRLPVNSLHYPHYNCPTKQGKPITIGEMGSMYYSTPDTVSREFGAKALESFNGRLDSVSQEAYHDLIGERKWASQVCVFNLVWYGLEPLPFTDQTLYYDDYTTPGIKPSRITPFIRTLNAGIQKNLQEYVPNAVWKAAHDAYIPARSFAEKLPESVWVDEKFSFCATTFNDFRDVKSFRLTALLVCGDYKDKRIIDFSIGACRYREDTVEFTIPCEGEASLTLSLSGSEEAIHECNYTLNSYDRKRLNEDFDKLDVALVSNGELPEDGRAVIDCRSVIPYSTFEKPAEQTSFFTSNTKYTFNSAQNCKIFKECLNFNAIPALTDGTGDAVALDLSCTGEKRIICGLQLADCNDPASALIKIELAKRLVYFSGNLCAPAYFLGDVNSDSASVLNELGCEYEIISKDDIPKLLRTKTNRVLIIDGDSDFNSYRLISINNFNRVLIMSPSRVPDFFTNEWTISQRKLFHLIPANDGSKFTGLNSNALYGLESGREVILADRALEFYKNNDGILLRSPDIDWRMWNNCAEPLKTVAVRRGEQRDDSRIAALAVKKHAGSDIYISTLSKKADNQKLRNIWARLFSSLGISFEMKESSDISELLSNSIYSGTIRRMLYRDNSENDDLTVINPGLNRVENGSAWIISHGQEKSCGLYAIYLYSPQDRRDLLLNPDGISMSLEAEADTDVYLNGINIGCGKKIDINNLGLDSGVNLLSFAVNGKSKMPHVTFARSNNKPLDISFRLNKREVKFHPMQNLKFKASCNDTYSSHASFTREHFWSTNCAQEAGISLNFEFPSEVTVHGLWFVSIKFHNEGEDLTPRGYKLLAGSCENDMREIYHSLLEEKMYYPRGRIYAEFDDVTARCFKFVLTENAPKELVISDMALLI